MQARELAREVYGRREGFWAEHGEDGGHDEGDTDSEGSSEGGDLLGIMQLSVALGASHAVFRWTVMCRAIAESVQPLCA